ncbi:hypothetical protein DFO73_101289 [Cytobacillus oceanisediminis]|uniref:Uncharacterized protein n=1 Tax=Cytobacillus oceanisediminis TaxID=665099 RepID=A0A2V3A7H4_9BACI|nr:hypothetical protein DFO73_101289 [Cytobacillus oceanisediminis]
MFLRTPTLRSGGLKLSYNQLRQGRLHTNVIKPVSNRGLVFYNEKKPLRAAGLIAFNTIEDTPNSA